MKEMKLIMENFKKNMSEMFKGRELTDDELEKMDPTMRGFIEKSRKSKGITSQAAEMAAESVRQEILDLYDKNLVKWAEIFHDVGDLINFVESQNIRWGVVTNKPSYFSIISIPCFRVILFALISSFT